MLQLLHLGTSAIRGAARLIILRTEFLIFQANEYLAFFDLVTFFNAYPRHAAGDFGVRFNFVMGNYVAGRGEHHSAFDVGPFGSSTNDFHFWRTAEQAIGQRSNTEQYDYDNSANDDASGPW